jgi:hypothetical protein
MSAKVLKRLTAQIQSGSTYESDAPFEMPFTAETLSQKYTGINDEAFLGQAFANVPQQGARDTGGSITQNLDAISCEAILEAAFGANSSGVFTLGSNTKKLSLCGLNSVNAIKYANAYVKRLRLSGSAGNLWALDYDIMSVTAQAREVVGNFPASPTAPGTPFTFHEAGGTGYVRIGDDTDALAGGDEINIEDFSIDITCGFDNQYCNEGTGTLTPTFGMVTPTIEGSFKIARHDTDNYADWADADTALQMAIYIYKSATANVLIEIPRLKINVELGDEELTKPSITMMIGRNGVGTSYLNDNMEFVSPVRITVVNS